MCIRKYSVSHCSGRYGCVSCNCRLDPLISDQSTLVIELRKSIQFNCPVITVIQNNVHEVGIILSKRNCQVLRTQTILVICVVPDLGDLHRGRFTCNVVSIRNGCVRTCCGSGRLISGLRVARRHCFFRPGIVDHSTVCIFRKAGDRCFPVITFIQINRFPVTQRHNDLRRTLACSISKVVPIFLDRCRCGLRCVGVGDRCCSIRHRSRRAVSRRVICYRLFFPSIDVFCRSVVLRKIGYRVCPVIGSIESGSVDLGSILLKNHHNFSRTFPVLIIIVGPVLFDRQREILLVSVSIVYRYQIFRVCCDLLFCVSVYDTVCRQRISGRNIALGDFIFGFCIKTVDLDAFAVLKGEFFYDILFKSNALCRSIRELHIKGSRTVDLNAYGKLGSGRSLIRRIGDFFLHFKGTLVFISILILNNNRSILVRLA